MAEKKAPSDVDKKVDWSDETLKTTWKAIADGKNDARWIICDLKDQGDLFKLEVVETGSKGMQELKKKLLSLRGRVVFGAFLVYGHDKRGGIVSKRKKWVYFSYVASNVDDIAKAKANFQKQKVAKFFGAVSASFDLTSSTAEAALSEIPIAAKLLDAGAAHKPSHFDFGEKEIAVEDIEKANEPEPDDDFD